MKDKILTLDDLYNFCLKNEFTRFSSKENGQLLVVQSIGTFEKSDDSTQGLMPVRLQACHTELNRNKSFIDDETMQQALPSLKNRPILANIIELDDGTYDFKSHDFEVIKDPFRDGEERINYTERAVGIIPESCNSKLEYDETKGKTYVVVDGYIFEDYGNLTADILRNKGECRVSVELCIEEMSFNAKEKYLSIDKFYFNGVTILGKLEDGTEVEEGMLGSNIVAKSFSNSNEKISLNDFQQPIESTLEGIEQHYGSKEGGDTKMKLDELLQKYGKTVDELSFEYENINDEELELKFKEAFEKEEDEKEEDDVDLKDEDPEDTEEQMADKKKCLSVDSEGNSIIEFKISHDDIRSALYNLIREYEDAENEWFYINEVFDDSFVMQACGGATYGQKYAKEEDIITLVGERYVLHCEYLTDSELAEINSIRSNYAELVEFKKEIEGKELNSKKQEVLSSEEYSVLSDNESFKDLIRNSDKYSVEELSEKADLIFAKHVKAVKQFSLQTGNASKKPSFIAYGKERQQSPEKNSYLEGLLQLNK